MSTGWERTFFITAVTWQRRSIFSNDALAKMLVETIYDYRAQGKFALHAFVAMPDHAHLLITPSDCLSLERAVQLIKGGFSHRVRETRPNLLIWEKSFMNHRILDVYDFERHREYIHQNPVRRGMVRTTREYPYSSANISFKTDPSPIAAAKAVVG